MKTNTTKRMGAIRGFGIFFVLWFVSVVGFANTYYISTTGSDASGDGSATNPWKTLMYAVTKVPANQGHTIQLAAGTFVENGQVNVPTGISIVGAGKGVTIIKAASSFYYHPADPGYSTDKFLISLSSNNMATGNQSLKNFTVDGDAKQLHGGIYVRYRSSVTLDGVGVQYVNFSGIWLWDVQNCKLLNSQLINCSWGSSGYCSGALNLGNTDHVEVAQLNVDENTGYGVKAIGPDGYNDIHYLTIHDCHVSVAPYGLWNNGSAPNIAIELWQSDLVQCEMYNNYVDNTISLVNSPGTSTGIQTMHLHDNTLDMVTRANGAGYGLELTIHDAEVDHNYFIKGTYGIANWDNPQYNWNIHHNTFYAIQGQYPGEVVRSQWSGLHNVKLYNNTIEFASDKTMNVVGVYGGASDGIDIQNNLFINNNTAYNYYTNQLVHTENGATITTLGVKNNLFYNLAIGTVAGTYSNNITANPQITASGQRPSPYYAPKAGSPLIDAGANLGFPFLGTSPDIGALEYGSSSSNVFPVVSITSPINNASFSSGSSITITASASDSDGTVSKVEFYSGTTLLGQSVTSPYSYTWSNVAAGSYSLTAKATDNSGVSTASAAVAVSVVAPNVPPSVSITSPTNNASFTSGSSITITASASDSDGTVSKVEFYSGGILLGQSGTSPYSFTWSNVAAGSYSLTAKATDNSSASTASAAVAVSVVAPNVPPSVSITSPANNASFTSGTSITITANASDSDGTVSKVEFYSGTTLLGQSVTSPYSYTWSNVAAGSYSLTAKATDNSGASTASAAVAVSVVAPNVPPSVSITSPTNNASFTSGSSITITASASDSDGTVSKVEFYSGGILLGQSGTSPYSFTWSNVAAGSYSLTAKATDNSGASTASAAVAVSVVAPNVPPSVSITSPANNASFTSGSSITITASASDSDGTVSKVEFYSGGILLGQSGTSPYSFTWSNVAAGSYSLTAKATDNSGVSTASAAVAVSVIAPNVPPSVSITSPANNASFTSGSSITITASASDSDGTVSKVEFYNGTTLLGQSVTSPYSYTWSNVAAGSYSLTAKATDNSGVSTASAAVAVSVIAPNVPPSVSITSPANNASFTSGSSITITASASDSDGTVSKVEFYSGGILLGQSGTSPYSFTWSNVAAGSYSLTAKATDNKNAVTTSSVIAITVKVNVQPSVSITSPVNKAIFVAGTSITISAIASDVDGSVSKVEFFNGATRLGRDLTSPYSFVWSSVPAGIYTLTAKATDNQNSVGTSFPITIAVVAPNVAPIVSITSPANNSVFSTGSSVTLSADASDSDGSVSKVEFYQGTTKLGESLTVPYSYTWVPSASNVYSITARAIDNLGAATNSAPISIIIGDLPTSVVKIGLYAPDAVLSGNMTLTSDATASRGSYFSVPLGSGKNYYIPSPASAQFNFEVTRSGKFAMWVRLKSSTIDHQGSLVYDGKGNWITWEAGVHTEWTWVQVSDASTGAAMIFSFAQGLNEIQMGWYDDDVEVDRIWLTNDLTFVPTDSNTSESQIVVYPNPISSTYSFQYSSPVAQQARVSIYDLGGLLVFQTAISLSAGFDTISMDASNINNGVYVLSFIPTVGQELAEQIIISH